MQNAKFIDSSNYNNYKNYLRTKSYVLDATSILIKLFNIIMEVQYLSIFKKLFIKYQEHMSFNISISL